MDFTTITQEEWDQLTIQEQKELGEALAAALPQGFRFHSICTNELPWSPQPHHLAILTRHLQAFVFIPGRMATLGYDPLLAAPSAELHQQWEVETRPELIDLSLDDFLAKVCTPLRTVHLTPFVIQAKPIYLGFNDWNWPNAWNWQAPRNEIHHDEVVNFLAKEGLRLPSSDEWEYSCSAGARTFFRWGNTCPLNEIPRFTARWDWHRIPNRFGLSFPVENQGVEVCQEVGIYRNGEGGTIANIAASVYSEWIPLASSFYWQWSLPVRSCYIRPVVAVAPAI